MSLVDVIRSSLREVRMDEVVLLQPQHCTSFQKLCDVYAQGMTVTKSILDCVVAVRFLILHLNYSHRSRLNRCYRMDDTVLSEDLRHRDLFSEYKFHNSGDIAERF